VSCLILTYHSHVVNGNGYEDNDHVALEQDLWRLHARGVPIVPLSWIVDWLLGNRRHADVDGTIAITFDDGCLLDVADLDVPPHGVQRSFLSILKDFAEATPRCETMVHATTFVIASEAARLAMDRDAFSSRGWMGHEWWRSLVEEPLMDLQNHSWDHEQKGQGIPGSGSFAGVADRQGCDRQLAQAGKTIARLAGLSTVPDLFAYPYGESSDYLREAYLPQYGPKIGLRAAFTTQPCQVTRGTSPWAIPRYVRGCDWTTRDDFDGLLDTLTGRPATNIDTGTLAL